MAHEGPINPMHSLCLAMGWGAKENLGQTKHWLHCLVTLLRLLLLQAFLKEKRIWVKQSIAFIAVFPSLGIELQKRFSWEPLQKHRKTLQSTEYFPNLDFLFSLERILNKKIFLSKNGNNGKFWFCSGKTISHTLCAQYQPGLGIKKIKTLSWTEHWYLIKI